MKKFLVGIIVLVGLLMVAALAAPVVYDVDKKLRPQIETAAAAALNGTLKIGKMKLSLWSGIDIKIDGITLKANQSDKPIVVAENASLEVPFKSLFDGSLVANLVLTKPEINVLKGKDGAFNFQSLLKASAVSPANAKADGASASGSGGADLSILKRVDVNLQIEEAQVAFQDFQSGFKTTVDSFNLTLKNVGFGKPIGLELSSNVDVKPSKDISTKGLLRLNGSTQINWGKETFDKVSTDFKVDLSGLKVKVAGLLNKQSGVPLVLDLKSVLTPKSLNLTSADLVVNDFRIKTTGNIGSFEPLKYNFDVSSTALDLKSWQKIVAPVGQFGMQGKLNMAMKLRSDGKRLNYDGQLKLAEGSLNAPGINKPVTALQADLLVKNDSLNIKTISALVGSSSLNLNGSITNFEAPIVSLGVYSPNISAFDFIAPKTEEDKKAKIAEAKENQPELTEAQIEQMLMGPIEQLKSIPIMKKLRLSTNVKVDKVFYDQLEIRNFRSDISYANLVFKLNKTQFDVFGGKAALVSGVDIRAKKPKYNVKAKLAGINTVLATKAFVPELAGSVTGLMSADVSFKGVGASKADLRSQLTGDGSFNLKDGTWTGLQALQIVGKKLEDIKGAKEQASKIKIGNKFKSFNGNFMISGGVVNLKNFIMDFLEAGTAIIGQGTVDFDLNSNLVVSILAPFNDPPKKIRYKDGRAQLPVEIKGKITEPKIDYQKMLKRVLGAYAEREIKKETKKKVDQEVQKLLKNKKAQDLLKKLGL